MEVVDGGLQTDTSARALRDALEDLVDRRRSRESGQFVGEVLLQRLTGSFRAALEARMDVSGKIANKYVRHAFIMLASVLGRKRLRAMGLT